MRTYFYPKSFYDEMIVLSNLTNGIKDAEYFDLELNENEKYHSYDILIHSARKIHNTLSPDDEFRLAIRFDYHVSDERTQETVSLKPWRKWHTSTMYKTDVVYVIECESDEYRIANPLHHRYNYVDGVRIYPTGVDFVARNAHQILECNGTIHDVYAHTRNMFYTNNLKYTIPYFIIEKLA